jgi:hypothetical protein
MGTFMNTNQNTLTGIGHVKHCIVALGLFATFACLADSATPTISLRKLPENLQKQYEKVQPELTERNRCVVAFVDSYDAEKMILECSFHTRVAAESERRALKYCNEKRKAKEISSPCRLVIE